MSPYAAMTEIPDGSVTNDKLAAGAALANLADASVTAAKLAADAKGELPVGTILDWAGTFDVTHKPDAGTWMECDGSAIAQATYADLYALFGVSRWGADAGGNFILPNFKRRVTVGRDSASPGAGLDDQRYVASCGLLGSETKQLSTNEIPTHTHGLSVTIYGSGVTSVSTNCASACTMGGMSNFVNYVCGNTGSIGGSCNTTSATCGSGTAFKLHQPYAVVYKLIKVKKAA